MWLRMTQEPTGLESFGGDGAVADLSRRYRSVLLAYFTRKGVLPADAQDLVQDVFARLATKSDLDDVTSADGYLFAVAANLATDYFRHRQVRVAHPATGFVEQVHRTEDFDPGRILEGRQELAFVVAALNGMPERMRNIFILARLENLPRAEIAQRLGVSKRTVEMQITLATACLADRRRRIT